jgi:D-sedoheptulose 7-phosphate isomerase
VSDDFGHVERFLAEATEILSSVDRAALEAVAEELASVRERGGRLFCVGSGGGAAHASHAVCDFRKLGDIEAYAPSDNAAELTARVNDDGWDSSYAAWLRGSRIDSDDLLFVFSVGGGDRERGISANLVAAIDLAAEVGARIVGIVGRDGGYTAQAANACVVVPGVNASAVTPHTEGMQSVFAHLLVSHPRVARATAKWEAAAGVGA